MNTLTRCMALLVSVSLLCGTSPLRASDIAGRPVKASVLVKPNMIIGLDDSGSMDAEVLFSDTNSGFFRWDRNLRSGWDSQGKLVENDGNSTALYEYLFPNSVDSTGASGTRLYSYFAFPPTKQFAFGRSSAYNPIYYDPTQTYRPWSPAYFGGQLHTFADADPKASLSHPAFGTSRMDLSAWRCSGAGMDEWFLILEGMVIDKGMSWGFNEDCSQTQAVDAPIQPGFASIGYYPATYWVLADCMVSAGDPSCAYAPDGKTLRRHEIKKGNTFPSGRSYEDELQNFANWFQYYRKRKLSLAASMGNIADGLAGMNVGVVPFHDRAAPVMYDMDSTAASENFRAMLAPFYLNNRTGGTPTRSTLQFIGNQFATNAGIVKYACQRNSALIATDGYADDPGALPPAYDASRYGSGAPYATTQAGSLADLALAYYTVNLRPDLPTGKVPTGEIDINPDLHMTTYALSLGSAGKLWPVTATPATSATPYAWPASIFGLPGATSIGVGANPTTIDELWHATINGRGQMYLATTPAATSAALQGAFDDMQSAAGVQASTSVSSINLTRGDSQAYVGSYNVRGWTGDLSAKPISSTTGAVGTSAVWSAGIRLAAKDWSTRVIATSNGSIGKPFTVAEIASLVNPANAHGSSADVINYLRGKRTGEGIAWRARYSLLGAIVNASPVVSRDDAVVYQASNEGMLHAFDTKTGDELWAYVPYNALSSIGVTTRRSYRYTAQLDGTPTLATVGTRKLLLGGRGAGGAGWYALDVTNPASIQSDAALASRALWEFPNAATPTGVKSTIGLSMGTPRIVRVKGSSNWVALVSSGYNSPAQDGNGRLFVLDALTGSVQQTLVAPAGGSVDPGFAQFSPYFEDDGSVQYVYGGDELGNLWRFDLVGNKVNRLAVLKDASGQAQPVTTAPALVYHQGQRIVYVGTGRVLGLTDMSATPGTQTLYAIADGSELATARTKLTEQVYTQAADSLTSNSVNWSTSRGWFIDLPAGEVVNVNPSLGFNALVAVSNQVALSDCSAKSRFYVVDMRSGSSLTRMGFVGSTISNTETSSRLVLLRTTGDRQATTSQGSTGCGVAGMTTTSAGEIQTRALNLCQAIPSRKNAWTEIRR